MKIKKVNELNEDVKSTKDELKNLFRNYMVDLSDEDGHCRGILEEDFDKLIDDIISTINFGNTTTEIETGYE